MINALKYASTAQLTAALEAALSEAFAQLEAGDIVSVLDTGLERVQPLISAAHERGAKFSDLSDVAQSQYLDIMGAIREAMEGATVQNALADDYLAEVADVLSRAIHSVLCSEDKGSDEHVAFAEAVNEQVISPLMAAFANNEKFTELLKAHELTPANTEAAMSVVLKTVLGR